MPDSASRGDGEGVAIQLLVYWCILLCQLCTRYMHLFIRVGPNETSQCE